MYSTQYIFHRAFGNGWAGLASGCGDVEALFWYSVYSGVESFETSTDLNSWWRESADSEDHGSLLYRVSQKL